MVLGGRGTDDSKLVFRFHHMNDIIRYELKSENRQIIVVNEKPLNILY